MTSKYWILTGEAGTKILTMFKVEVDNVAQTVQAYVIINRKWEATEYLWELLAENDMRLDPVTDEEGEKLELSLVDVDAE